MLVVWIKEYKWESIQYLGSRPTSLEPLQCCGHFPPSSRRFTAAGCCCQGGFDTLVVLVSKMVWLMCPSSRSSSWLLRWSRRVVQGADLRNFVVNVPFPQCRTAKHMLYVSSWFSLARSWLPTEMCPNLSSGHVRCGDFGNQLEIRLTFVTFRMGRNF